MSRFIKIGEFAQRVNRSPQTIRKWEREGAISAVRTVGNQRLYDESQVDRILGLKPEETQRRTIAYTRVSSSAQKPDLKNQVKYVEAYCVKNGILVDEWVEEIGGGMNFKRAKFMKLIDQMLEGKIRTIIIAHKDRLTRFGFDLVEQLARKFHVEIIAINVPSTSPEQEIVEDLMTVIHSFSSRVDGLRKYARKIREEVSSS